MEPIFTYIEEYNMLKVQAPENQILTDYTEDMDIKEYNAFTIAYCPVDVDRSKFRVLTIEESAVYYNRAQEEIRKEFEEKGIE